MKSRLFAVLLTANLLSQPAVAQFFNSERSYEGPDPVNEDRSFGTAGLELNDDRMLIMGYADSTTGNQKLYLYNPITGSLIADVAVQNPDPGALATDLSDNWLVLGEYGYDTGGLYNVGRVWLHDATDGSYVRTFVSPNPGQYYEFGRSVAIDGDRLLIGETFYGPGVAGRAHLFNAETGALLHTIERPDTGSNGYDFGVSGVLLGDIALIGDESNHVFVFDANTGNLLRTIKAPVGVDFDATLEASGDLVAIGAGGYYSTPERVFVYRISTGELVNSFANPSVGIAYEISDSTDHFGDEIAISGDRLLVSASLWAPYPEGWPAFTTWPTQGHGRAYLFDALSGELLETLDSPVTDFGTAYYGAVFGRALALDGNTAVVGAAAILNGGSKFTNGTAYVYSDAFQVEIDILPGDPDNTVDINSAGQVEVAILTTAVSGGDATNFQAAYADATTLRIGPNQVAATNPPGTYTDVEGDSDQDLVAEYSIPELALVCEQQEPVTLTGETVWGQNIWAIDSVTTNNCPSCHP